MKSQKDYCTDCGGIRISEPDFAHIKVPEKLPTLKRKPRKKMLYPIKDFLDEVEALGYTGEFVPGDDAYVQNAEGETVEFYVWQDQPNAAVFVQSKKYRAHTIVVLSPDDKGFWIDHTFLLYPVEG